MSLIRGSRVGWRANSDNVTNFTLLFFEVFPKQEIELFETENGIILTFKWDCYFSVNDLRLLNFVKI